MHESSKFGLIREDGSPWSVRDAAMYLQISSRHLFRLIGANRIKSIYIGRRVFLSDLEVKRIASEGVK